MSPTRPRRRWRRPRAAGDAGRRTPSATQVQVFAEPAEGEPATTLDNPNENGAPLVFLVEQDQGEWLAGAAPDPSQRVDRAGSGPPTSRWRPPLHRRHRAGRPPAGRAQRRRGRGRRGHRRRHRVDARRRAASTTSRSCCSRPIPNGAYGPYAYGLSGFSNVLDEFNGGDGVIGIHGTNEPEAIGTRRQPRLHPGRQRHRSPRWPACCRSAPRSTSTPRHSRAGVTPPWPAGRGEPGACGGCRTAPSRTSGERRGGTSPTNTSGQSSLAHSRIRSDERPGEQLDHLPRQRRQRLRRPHRRRPRPRSCRRWPARGPAAPRPPPG